MIFNTYLPKFSYDSIIGIQNFQSTLIVFFAALLVTTIIQWIVSIYRETKTLPPGPWGVPFLGYLAFIGNEKHTKYAKLAKQYGRIFCARLGCQLTVVISDYQIIREAFRHEEFTGRPNTPLMSILNGFGKFATHNHVQCIRSDLVCNENNKRQFSKINRDNFHSDSDRKIQMRKTNVFSIFFSLISTTTKKLSSMKHISFV
jgi:Cytochrome P450